METLMLPLNEPLKKILKVVDIDESEQWDNIVKSFKNYDVNYLSGYVKAFQKHGDGKPLLFCYDDGDTKGMNVVMKRDIATGSQFKDILPLDTWFDISTPYGYGGFWIEGDNPMAVEKAYEEYCKEEGFVSEFVRFHLINDYQNIFTGEVESNTRNVVRSLDLSVDEMWMDFKGKVRTNVRKAQKNGLTIFVDEKAEKLEDFLDIYYGTMDRNDATNYYMFTEEFFESINKLNDNYVYFHVLYEGKVISTELVLYGTENCYDFLGGTNKDYFHLRPNEFLKFEIMKAAKEKGFKRLILGGGCGQDDGLFKYKEGFAPEGVCKFYTGKRIFNQEKYDELLKIRSEDSDFDPENEFFPQYRAG